MRLLIAGVLVISGCELPSAKQPFTGAVPPHVDIDMGGTFTFGSRGELSLALAKACTVNLGPGGAWQNDCEPQRLEQIAVMAHTPWNADIRGTWNDASHLVFWIDWRASGIDPLAEETATLLARPWAVSGTQWQPTSADSEAMLKLVSAATETETELVPGGPPPKLEITTFEADGGALRGGGVSTLVVRIANSGAGAAYRVRVTLRSRIDALHGRHLSFGKIRPGSDKTRTVKVKVPLSEAGRDVMLVLTASEGNGNAPPSVNRRVAIVATPEAPALVLQCSFAGHKSPRPHVQAGDRLAVRCVVSNTGDAAASAVGLEASIGPQVLARSKPIAVGVAGRVTVDTDVVVPRALPIGTPFDVVVTARDRASASTTRHTIGAVVGKPTPCTPGQLSRAQYDAKLKEARAAEAAGAITKADVDKYDAELTACL